jgi:small-conductance mechanosensitive channel
MMDTWGQFRQKNPAPTSSGAAAAARHATGLRNGALRATHIAIIVLAAVLLQALSCFIIAEHIQTQRASEKGASCRHQTLASVAVHAVTWLIAILATLMVLERMCVPLGTLLAVSGIGALIVGIGARAMIRDFFASLLILGEKQFYHGEDVVIYGPVMNLYLAGLVESVNLRTTELRQSDGALVFIPNGGISAVANFSRGAVRVRLDLKIRQAAATPALFAALRAFVERSRGMANVDNIAALGVTSVHTDHVVFSVVAVTNAAFRNDVLARLNRGAWRTIQRGSEPPAAPVA